MQADLAKANEEITTGRHADVGLQLGSRTGHAISLRQERAELDAIVDSNAAASLRLSATKTSLDYIRTTANDFLSSLAAVGPQGYGLEAVMKVAERNLGTLTSEMNRVTGGQYIFAGTDTRVEPMRDYADSAPSGKSAVDAAFLAEFGFPQSDDGTRNISAVDMEAFLAEGGPFDELFEDPSWNINWSNAASVNIVSKISTTERVETSTNANETAIRNLAKAYVMVSQLAVGNLNPEARQVLIDKAISTMGASIDGLVQIQANLGVAEKRISDANNRMDLQKIYFDEQIGKLEGVDPADAKARVDALMTQMQMSYSLTSQLRQLNLLNYL